MDKSYTWKEIKDILKKELHKTKCILTYGTIGSRNIEKDIDTIITKKPNSKSGDFFKEIHDLFDKVNKYLQKKHNAKLIRTSRFSDEEETKYIANFNNDDLVFQVLTYTSFKQIKMHWHADLRNDENVKEILDSSYKTILGNKKDIFSKDFNKFKHEELFIRLNDSDRINSHFPEDFLVKKMNILYDFIVRKRLGNKINLAKTINDVRETFYKVCDIIEKAN